MDLSPLISFVLEYVTPLVTKEVLLIGGARDEVRSLHTELQFIDNRLKEFDDRLMEDIMLKEWLSQMQDVAEEAKDVIDTFLTENDIQQQRNWVAKCVHGVRHAAMLRNVAGKVQKIKQKIEEIDSYRRKYCIDHQVANRNTEKAHRLEKRRWKVEEENVVGFGDAAKQVMEMVINNRLRRDVISILGMAGSGKTTLARMIYGHSDIEKQFQCRTWIHVPSKCRIGDLLIDILKSLMSIGEETTKLDDLKLAEKLKRCLQGKRYLVVMDGLEKTQLWEDIEKDFPDEKCGSRILLTTRSKRVASVASSTRTHSLKPLGEKERWELLEKLVFKDETCPQELVKLGKQIAAKCAGLPLAIVSLASLLARNRTYRQWLDILSNVRWYLKQEDSPPWIEILALSYDCIPEHLKRCFLYLGVFPDGFEISARQVINLWIAEELVKETAGKKVEDIAERYLEELIDLSLIEVARKRSDGGARTFRLHEFWWNFCVNESERTRFLEVQMNIGLPRRDRIRRLSIRYEASRYIFSRPLDSCRGLHSLLCFHNNGSLESDGWALLCSHFRKLRVLDLGSTYVPRIPKSIEGLSLLKYLKINSPSLNRLPSSLSSLRNLQTFNIRNSCVSRMPSGIWGMQNLRHLLLPRLATLPESRWPHERLLHIQTLCAITPDRNTADLIVGSKFPSLVKLTLYSQDKWKTKGCLECLDKLDCLQNLKIINPAVFPNAEAFPSSLIKVTLMKTDLTADKVGMLENLPRLQVLKLLTRSIRGPKLEFKTSSFPQLRFLFMEEIDIRTWTMGDGSMESLEELTIIRCHVLETLPKQLWHLKTLGQVKVNSPSPYLKQRLEQLRVETSEIQIHY